MNKNLLLTIHANKKLEKYYLKSINDSIVHFTSGTSFSIQPGWYNLIVEYQGEKVDIEDITINGESLGHFIYTGFFTEHSSGKRFQPANSLWTEGYYSLWIHTEIGHLVQTHTPAIRNGDYGKNLFDDYLFTVDKSITLESEWPEIIKSYFRYGNGPRWWRKSLKKTPYEIVESNLEKEFNKTKILEQIHLDCKVKIDYEMLVKQGHAKTKTMQGVALRRNSVYPYIDIDSLKSEEMKRLIHKIGFTKLLNITLQTALPGQAFVPHVDDHYTRDCRQDIEGPVVFLWNLATDTKGHLFKLNSSGLLPLDKGVFFNQFYYDHGTINDSKTAERPLLIIHGVRNKEISYL